MRALLLLIIFLATLPVAAAEIEVGGAHVMLAPMGDTGALDIQTSRGFGAHVEVFWSDRVSTRAAATFLNPAAILYPDNPPPNDIDLGTLGLDIYSLTARAHFGNRLSGFAGGGAAIVQIGNLDDRFDDEIEVEFDAETMFVVEAGVRYRLFPRVVLELGAAYMPLEIEAPAPLPSKIAVDPLVVSAGAAWRF